MNMKKLVALALSVVMILAAVPMSAFADVEYDQAHGGCDYYNLISKNDYALAPGATESEIIINNDEGTARNVVHVIEVDLTNPNISVMPATKNISETTDYSNPANWGIMGVTQHAAYAEEELGLNVVGGMNVSLSWDFTHPYGLLIYNGVVLCDTRSSCEYCGKSTGHPGGGYLAVTKDGKAELRAANAPLTGDEWMAQTICFSYIVKDGVSMHTAENHADDANAAPRSVIGIKEDGTLVLMMVDGRQAPYSKGMQNHEMAEMMLELGCVDAINCDGGGSSTFITEREGTGELTMKSSPSDGSERSTISGILVISKAVADGKFDHATVKAQNDYVTPGSSVVFTATGADSAGGPADVPADVTWQLADSTMGTIENGVFVSNGTVGTATAQLVYNGEVVGEDSVEVVIPESISFVQANITAPYSKSVTLDLVAKYGFNEVTLKDGDITYALSDSAIGTLDGNVFSATSDESVTSGTVTATLVHNTALTATANITLGKASEVVYDFESGADSIANLSLAYKAPYTPDKYNFLDSLDVVTAEDGGKVKNGNYSLRVTSEGDSITCMNWCQTRINGWNIDLKDAISLSFWMYIPEGSHGLEWDFGNAIPVNLGQEFVTGTGWQYFTVNVADIGTNVTKLDQVRLYHSDTFDDYPNYYTDVVYYIDDITVNYSTAVEDFDPPVISDVLISHDNTDTGIAMNGQTIDANVVTITAKAADDMTKTNYTGLDTASVKVFVDGMEVAASCSDNGFITIGDITLANGTHTFRIEASDNNGNMKYVEKSIVIAANNNTKNTIKYAPADATKVDLLADSLFYNELTATAIDKVEKVEVVIDLDNNSEWELDYMTLADGFEAEYTVDNESNDATIVIERTGTVTATGEAVLASLPVRVWSPSFANVNEDAYAYRLMAVESFIEKGMLTETDNTTAYFASAKYSNVTEFNDTRLNSTTDMEGWHAHTATAVEDVAATCTETGYTGRTYCEGCESVVDWGSVVEATGHINTVEDMKVVCGVCGEKDADYSGYLETADGWMYFLEGTAMTNWINLEDGWHYFMPATGLAAVGTMTIDGREYRFEGEQGKSLGAWDNGRFYLHVRYVKNTWMEIDGNTYYFENSGYYITGDRAVAQSGVYLGAYSFDENGVMTGKITGVFCDSATGLYHYADDGVLFNGGLVEWNGNIYYAKSNHSLATSVWYVDTHALNGLADKAGVYTFGADGKMQVLNGVVEAEGGLVYYINGEPQRGLGLVEWEGDYYYVRGNGFVMTDGVWYVDNTNAYGFPAGVYSFDADGKMLVLDGIVDVDGALVYYIDGIPQRGLGLVEWEGDYYYVRGNGYVMTDGVWYVDNTNAYGFPAGIYSFDADGKMLVLDGVVDVNGDLVYYIDGIPQRGLGLVEWEGDYYYVRGNGYVMTDGVWYVDNTNAYGFPAGIYSFDADGKMLVLDGVVDVNGDLVYYINGIPQRGLGLVEWEGDYYYVRGNGYVMSDGVWYVDRGNVGGFEPGVYEFGADGKMIIE